jgi:RHS repeat-associated protein
VTIAHTVTAGNQTDLIQRNGTQIGDYNYVGSQVKRLLYETGANDVTANRYYDGAGRMTRLAWDQTSNSLPKFAYSYDPAGNILTKTHDHRSGDPIEKYGIDSLYRLTDARYDFRTLTHDFDYDDLGNWLTYTNNGAAQTRYHNAVNEITKIGPTEMLYDAAGNLTKDNAGGNGPYHTFYDAENRLTRIEQDNSTLVAGYEYDALGRRIEFIDAVGSVTKRYLHDADQVIEEYNGAATPARQRYYVWGNYIDELLMMHNDDGGSGTDYFVCHDQIYSPQALLNSTGSIVERYDYDAYGQPAIYTDQGNDSTWFTSDDTNSVTSAQGLKYLFTGRELDNLDSNALKLYYYRARSYDPLYGRFLQRDSTGYVDGMNLYEYVRSNPISALDPAGHGIRDFISCWGFCIEDTSKELESALTAAVASGLAGACASCPMGKQIVLPGQKDVTPAIRKLNGILLRLGLDTGKWGARVCTAASRIGPYAGIGVGLALGAIETYCVGQCW